MPSKSKKQSKFMTAACKNPDFRKEVGISKAVACDFHDEDRGKFHSISESIDFDTSRAIWIDPKNKVHNAVDHATWLKGKVKSFREAYDKGYVRGVVQTLPYSEKINFYLDGNKEHIKRTLPLWVRPLQNHPYDAWVHIDSYSDDGDKSYRFNISDRKMLRHINENRKTVDSVEISEIPLKIELKKGDFKTGVSYSGEEWSQEMFADYGYIANTNAIDGDNIDVYVKPGTKNVDKVYVLHQLRMDGSKWDEDKVMIGWATAEEARKAWARHIPNPKEMFGGICEFTPHHLMVMALQAKKGMTILSSELMFDELKEKKLLPQGVKSPIQTAKAVKESKEIDMDLERIKQLSGLDYIAKDTTLTESTGSFKESYESKMVVESMSDAVADLEVGGLDSLDDIAAEQEKEPVNEDIERLRFLSGLNENRD